MKYPNKINICGEEWKIVYKKLLKKKNGDFGWADLLQHTIYIDNTKKASSIDEKTLLHEILHACFFTSFTVTLPKDEEEAVVRALELTLHSFLTTNKPFWVMRKKEKK